MAEANGPTQLLEVCGQRFSQFLHNAKDKHLAWLREVEEQGMRLLESSFGAEPILMHKTPSQRRRPRKRQSSCMKEENKEPNRRRLSRRRSSTKPSSQRRQSKEQPQNPSCREEEVAVPHCAVGSQGGIKTKLLVTTGKGLAEAQDPVAKTDCQDSRQDEHSGGAAHTEQPSPQRDEATEHTGDASCSAVIAPAWTAGNEEQPPKRTVSTSTPKATKNGDPATLQGDLSPQGLEEMLFQDSESKMTTVRSKARHCSGRRSIAGRSHKSRRASLVEKCSLVSKRESMIQRSVSRAISKKAAAQESSSASSRVSCQSSLEVFVEDDVTNSARPEPELDPPGGKAPEDALASSQSMQVVSPPASPLPPPEQQAGSNKGSCMNPTSEPQNENHGQPHHAKAPKSHSGIWTRSYKQAMGALWNGQQSGAHTLSLADDKHKNSSSQAPPSSSSASRVVRPLKNFLQAVQRNQLLASPGSTGHGGVIKNFIKRNTPSRPDLKGDFVEKERQRLESLRRKQEAEEERRKKVEEEKKRRQAEMKQKREERLRKALQARERVEQMEEEKKKRMEQKILQSDEKARLSQVREEKVAEERSKKKLSKKCGEADARKQKAPRAEESESEQPEPLQKRREDEVKEKGKRVWELRKLVEQQQMEQGKERDHKQRGKEKGPQPQLESAAPTEKNRKEEETPKVLQQQPGQEKRSKPLESIAVASNPWLKAAKEEGGLQEPWQQLGEGKIRQPETLTAATDTWLSKTVKKSISTSCLGPPKATRESGSPMVDENNYGMDLNSDDSTDDENEPRKPVPAWADGAQLNEAIVHQYYHPMNIDQLFGLIPSPKLEDIFGKSKPRYFKRTSSAVWHSPPGTLSTFCPSCSFNN